MKIISGFLVICFTTCTVSRTPILSHADMTFLEGLTRAVVDSSRIFPGQELPPSIRSYGPNNSGITLIKPGGRDCYPSFWIRDYGMSLECEMITPLEQADILIFTAGRQSDSTWTTKTGSLVPRGSIPDHIRINDGLPVYFPGTYDYVYQGNEIWRMPPYCDEFFFIHMAWYYVTKNEDFPLLNKPVNNISLFDRLEMAFQSVPASAVTQMAFISDTLPTCDFGFRDMISLTGEVCFGSLLRYRAALEMAELCSHTGNMAKSDEYRKIAGTIRNNLVAVFADERGILRASTGKSRQPDVWATAFAVYTGALDAPAETRACTALAGAFLTGTLAMDGQIRHVLTTDDFSATTAWEGAHCAHNSYQNGAYWATATGWVCYAISRVDRSAAARLASEYIGNLRKTDFRLPGQDQGGPYECIYPPTGHKQNPVYMTSVTGPYAAFRKLTDLEK
jgi:hypothetical protein